MRSLPRPIQPPAVTVWKAANPTASNTAPPFEPWAALGTEAKQSAQTELAKNQGYICAYCESRIQPDGDGMKIEHWIAQGDDGDDHAPYRRAHRFDWSNWLAVCRGGQPVDRERATTAVAPYCERARGDQQLHLNPYTFAGDLAAQFTYYPDGRVEGVSPDATADLETLKLNNWPLKANRANIREKLAKELKAGRLTPARLPAEVRAWLTPDASGALQPHVSAAVYYLTRWMRHTAGQSR